MHDNHALRRWLRRRTHVVVGVFHQHSVRRLQLCLQLVALLR